MVSGATQTPVVPFSNPQAATAKPQETCGSRRYSGRGDVRLGNRLEQRWEPESNLRWAVPFAGCTRRVPAKSISFGARSRSRPVCTATTPRSVTNFNASCLNSRLDTLRCMKASDRVEKPYFGVQQAGSRLLSAPRRIEGLAALLTIRPLRHSLRGLGQVHVQACQGRHGH
jgi:hypothetical protein